MLCKINNCDESCKYFNIIKRPEIVSFSSNVSRPLKRLIKSAVQLNRKLWVIHSKLGDTIMSNTCIDLYVKTQ